MLFEITIVAGRVRLAVGSQVDLHSFPLEDVKGELAHWPAEELDMEAVAEVVKLHDSEPVDIGPVCDRVDDGADYALYVDSDERRAWLIAQQRDSAPSESVLQAFLDAHRIAWHDDDPHWLGAARRMRFGLPALVVEATRRGGVYLAETPLLSLPGSGGTGDPGILSRIRPVVLVVDSTTFSRKKLVHALADDYDVLEAATAQEMIGIYEEFAPDAVLLDSLMPEFDAQTVVRLLKAKDAAANIGMVATSDGSARLIDALQAGAADFVVKPYDDFRIRGCVERMLRPTATIARSAA